MARLPVPGGDENSWGAVLNKYLLTVHNDDGSLKDGIVTSANLQDGAVSEAKLSSDVQTKLNATGSGSAAVSSVNGQTGDVTLTASDVGAATAIQGSVADSAVQPADLAAVATSGDYNDLANRPTIPTLNSTDDLTEGVANLYYTDVRAAAAAPVQSVNGKKNAVVIGMADIANLQTSLDGKADSASLAAVATSGSYTDLSNTPTLFSGNYTDLTGAPSLAPVATSGSYTDLSGQPTLFSGAYADLTGAPVLATVATSGSYNDLTDQPAIPANLDDLADVSTAGATSGQVLKFDGTSWGPDADAGAGTSGDPAMGGDLSGTASNAQIVAGAVSNTEVATAAAIDQSKIANLSTDLASKANAADVYSKTEVDTSLAAKADASSVYTKTEVDSALTGKLDTTGGTLTGPLNVQDNLSVSGNLTTVGTVNSRDMVADGSKLDGIEAGAQVNDVTSVAGRTGDVVLSKNDVGLSNVDNTADLAKPISTATQTALDAKVNTADLATVATSGSYTDLSNLPAIPNSPDDIGAATAVQGATADSAVQPADLATVATSGQYTDLTGTPDLSGYMTKLNNDITITDSDAQYIAHIDIQDDGTASSTWPNRFSYNFNGHLTQWHNEYGEWRGIPAKHDTVGWRVFARNNAIDQAHDGYVWEIVYARDQRDTKVGIAEDKLASTIPLMSSADLQIVDNADVPTTTKWSRSGTDGSMSRNGVAMNDSIVLGASDPVPANLPAGTIIVRTS